MKKTIILLLVFFISAAFAQNTSNTDGNLYKQAVLELQKKLDTQQEEIKTLRKQVDDGTETKEKADMVYNRAKDLIDFFDSSLNILIALIALFLTVAGLSYWFGIKKTIDYRFSKILKERETEFVNMFKKHQKENDLLRDAKILIINKKGTGVDERFKMILKRFSEEKPPIIVDTEDLIKDSDGNAIANKLDTVHAIILDNVGATSTIKNWDFNAETDLKQSLIDLAKKAGRREIAFLYFGEKNKDGNFSDDISPEDGSYFINFANKPATLFANLIDLLDYRRLIKQNN
jgi:hypothetical protein